MFEQTLLIITGIVICLSLTGLVMYNTYQMSIILGQLRLEVKKVTQGWDKLASLRLEQAQKSGEEEKTHFIKGGVSNKNPNEFVKNTNMPPPPPKSQYQPPHWSLHHRRLLKTKHLKIVPIHVKTE